MKEMNVLNYDEADMLGYDDVLRYSPAGLEDPQEPYRCPVSTPAGNRRPYRKHNPDAYVTFTNLNRSMQIPKSSSAPKHSSARYLYKRRATTNAQPKNFDCYYINRVKSEVHIDAQTNPSTWLNSLCSQPVDEIFTKYKRRSEAADITKTSQKTRNLSTPGERALITAWSSNASQRGMPSPLSPTATKSVFSSRNSKYQDNMRLYSYDSESDRTTTTTGPVFALMPVPMSPQKEIFFSPRESYRSVSPENVKHSKNLINHNLVHESTVLFDSSVYEPYQRDRRFPEMKVRQRSMTPNRKRVSSEPGGTKRPQPTQELQESAIHVISIGHIFENKDTPVTPKPVQRSCSYRLPKNMSTSLPELQGTAIHNMTSS